MDLAEHLGAVFTLVGVLWTLLLGCLIYIFNGVKSDIGEVKKSLAELTGQLFTRVTELEKSIERLWGEHRATHDQGRRNELP